MIVFIHPQVATLSVKALFFTPYASFACFLKLRVPSMSYNTHWLCEDVASKYVLLGVD